MIELKNIKKKDIPSFFANEENWAHSFLPVSPHRLLAHFNNPQSSDDDTVLLLAYLDGQLVGYMGVFVDSIMLNEKEEKIGWLSTWWVDPITKGKGVGREILNQMYVLNNEKIGISQFTPSAKRVYDKSGYFFDLKKNLGIKAVIRSNLTFVIPTLFPKLIGFKGVLNFLDTIINVPVNLLLWLRRPLLERKLKGIQIDYLNRIDSEVKELLEKFGKKDLSRKDESFFEWLKAYPWVLSSPLFNQTHSDKYVFSMYARQFEIFLIKISEGSNCKGFIVLQRRDNVLKLLFSYCDSSIHGKLMARIITLHAIKLNVREIIIYDQGLVPEMKKIGYFLYKTNKQKQSIISKTYGVEDFSDLRMQLGDGDCSFT